MVVKDKMSVI